MKVNLIKTLSKIEKRKRFIISSSILTLLMIISTFLEFDQTSFFLPIALVIVYIASYFAILEGISKSEYIMLFITPLYFTLAFYLFYFFLPQRWLTRLPFTIIYAISIYAILLSQNIFNVGVVKSLQLFRAAFSVNYLFVTITMFLTSSLLFSFHLNFLLNGFIMIVLSTPLVLHLLWSVNPTDEVPRNLRKLALLVGMIVGETTFIFSFVPINSAIFALLVAGVFYSLSGLFQAYLQERLFKERVREYIFVLSFIGLIVFLSLGW